MIEASIDYLACFLALAGLFGLLLLIRPYVKELKEKRKAQIAACSGHCWELNMPATPGVTGLNWFNCKKCPAIKN
ncbi:MAG: hypothetical protein A3B92_02020 [Candidatus Harrisonbacteria bacterium RIFCSPHIGHO2_02_FULL_42_16]|uniref:Uncharacterized protein n=1 Tax=Candidatus Harrisonbacteria bacterium RIFCSPHIGHO2_02_FULL_42_16 TaxID=1798404 RepID=A0A1G1ZGU4_9BACT|nr:MAG: hypothetical protein A3B92_02020 [Candidatus Harrisonbacteria bacterium RIFCSPHIGHO2_02_FULL_42_16]